MHVHVLKRCRWQMGMFFETEGIANGLVFLVRSKHGEFVSLDHIFDINWEKCGTTKA